MSETGDMKFLNVCRRHLDIFKSEPRWNPSNARLSLVNLEAKLESGYPLTQAVNDKFAAHQIVVNNRQDSFAKIAPLARSARRYFRSCGATENELQDANRYINSLVGQTRKTPRTVGNGDGAAAQAVETHAKTQLSYDGRYANLQGFHAFAVNVTAYQPNENELKPANIESLIADCGEANNAVSISFVPLSSALNARDEGLYTAEDSILEDYRLAKEYYKSLYEPKDPQYKTITAADMKLRDNSR